MNTFLTEFEHGRGENRRVNFSLEPLDNTS